MFIGRDGSQSEDLKSVISLSSFVRTYLTDDIDFSTSFEGAARAYAVSVVAHRCISIRANAFSTLPLRVLDDDDLAIKDKNIRKFFRLRDVKFLNSVLRDWDIFGKIILLPSPDNKELLRINPINVKVNADVDGIRNLEQRINGKVTGLWTPEELVYLWDYNAQSDLEAFPPLYYLFGNIKTELDLVLFINNYLENGGTPIGVLSTEQTLREEDAARIQRMWQSTHGGGENTNKIAVIGGGTTYQAITPSIKDMVVGVLGEQNTKRICQMYGVPMTMVFEDGEGANRSNSDYARESFYKETLIPLAQLIWSEISIQGMGFIEKEDHLIQPDTMRIEVLQNDNATITTRSTTSFKSGVMTLNQALALENLPPLEGGELLFIGGRLIPTDKLKDSEALNLILEGTPLNSKFEPNETEQVNPEPNKQAERNRDKESKKAVSSLLVYEKTAILSDLAAWKKKIKNKNKDVKFVSEFIPLGFQELIKMDIAIADSDESAIAIIEKYINAYNETDTVAAFEKLLSEANYWQGFSFYQKQTREVLAKYFNSSLEDDTFNFFSENDVYVNYRQDVLEPRRLDLIANLNKIAIITMITSASRVYSQLGKEDLLDVNQLTIKYLPIVQEHSTAFVNSIFENTEKIVKETYSKVGSKEGFLELFKRKTNDALNWIFSKARESFSAEDFSSSIWNDSYLESASFLGSEAIWQTAKDDNVCTTCEPLDGLEGDYIDGFIYNGVTYYAPAHKRCRCFYVLGG